MKLLTQLIVSGALATASVTASAYDCVLGGVGHCIWAIDKDHPQVTNLIDATRFVEFCDQNNIHCSTYNNGYNGIVGRYLNDEVLIITSKGWGGPDLIFDNKTQAAQFVDNFKQVANHPEAKFYVKNAPNELHPRPRIVAVGYHEGEAINLLFLPNEAEETGENYPYIPEDM